MPETKSEDATIHYEVEGTGEPLVLAHLYPRDLRSWRQAGYVDALKDHYQLILIDSRGFGMSEKDSDSSHYDAEHRANDVVAVLDDLGTETAHYWGYSFGGRTGLALAKYAPDRLRTLILGGVELSPDNSGFADIAQRIKDAIAAGTAAEQMPANDPAAMAACLEGLMTDPPFEDVMSRTRIPCLLYAGTADRFYAGSKKAATGVIPNAQFFELPDLDHNQSFNRSELVVAQAVGFLDAHD